MTDANPAASGTASVASEKERAATQTQRRQDILQAKAARDAELKAAMAREGISDHAPPPPRATAADLEDAPWPSEQEELAAQLAEHATAIRALEDRNGAMWMLERRNVFKIGQRLITVKSLVGHGHFLNWMKREFRWSPKTGQNYMNVAKAFGDKRLRICRSPSLPSTCSPNQKCRRKRETRRSRWRSGRAG